MPGFAHSRQTDSGITPARISSANSLQPTQNAAIDSRPEPAIIATSSRSATRVIVADQRDQRDGDRHRGADRLRESLRRSRNRLGRAEARRHEPGRSLPERAERRTGEDAGDEAVGQHRREPVRAADERHDREREDAARDDAGRLFVDRIGEAGQRSHHLDMIRSSPTSVRY